MKGCYGVTIHYLRVLCLFAAPVLFIASGMAFNQPVRVGNVVLEVGAWELVIGALLCWVIVAARVMRKH